MDAWTNELFVSLPRVFHRSRQGKSDTERLFTKRHFLFFGIPWSAFGIARMRALLCCIINVRVHLLSLGGDAAVVNRGSAFLSGVFPCLPQGFPMSAQGGASSYTVPTIRR